MAVLRKDPVSSRWVIINVDNPKGPEDFEREEPAFRKGPCPF